MSKKLKYRTTSVRGPADPEYVPGELEEQPEFNAEAIGKGLRDGSAEAWAKKHTPELYAKLLKLRAQLKAAGKSPLP